MMTTPRAWLGVGVAVAGVCAFVGFTAPAGADCGGPHMWFTPEVAGRGEAVTVMGEFFGDNCYDTGPPPDGATGVLGEPRQDIELRVVQGDREIVVGEADADDDYAFTVTVVLPASLEPGPAQIRGRFADGADFGAYKRGLQVLTVTDEPPIEAVTTTAAAPPSGSEAALPPEPSSDEGKASKIALPAGVLVLAILGAGALALRRRRGTPTRA